MNPLLRLLLGSVAVLALAAPPTAAVPLVNLGAAVGIAFQGDFDDAHEFLPWAVLGPPVCGQTLTDFRLTLRAETWTDGDVLTLHARAWHGVISQATSGAPPSATIEFTSGSTCASFAVEGTRVALADVYTVTGL